jgi:hypothetical protein
MNLLRPLQALFADQTFVLLEPFPLLTATGGAVPKGYKLCLGCHKKKELSAFWAGRARCKNCLRQTNSSAYRVRRDSRLGGATICP